MRSPTKNLVRSKDFSLTNPSPPKNFVRSKDFSLTNPSLSQGTQKPGFFPISTTETRFLGLGQKNPRPSKKPSPLKKAIARQKSDRADQATGFLRESWLGDRDYIKKPGFSYPQKCDRPPKNLVRSKDFSLTNPCPSQETQKPGFFSGFHS